MLAVLGNQLVGAVDPTCPPARETRSPGGGAIRRGDQPHVQVGEGENQKPLLDFQPEHLDWRAGRGGREKLCASAWDTELSLDMEVDGWPHRAAPAAEGANSGVHVAGSPGQLWF